METRLIGGQMVGEVGLGCMGMSHAYGPSDEKECLAVLDRAMELGCNFWDTADFYGAGRNELLLCKALVRHRGQVFLATKAGNVFDRALSSHRDQVEANAPWIVDGTPEYIRKCIDRSLMRLGVEHVDLYYLHRVDPLVPIEETFGAMADLVSQGKVRFLGLSEASADTIRRAAAVHPVTALQTEYSLWSRDVEGEILPVCRQLGIAFVPYAPLGRGFLSGAISSSEAFADDDWRRTLPRFQADYFEINLAAAARVRSIAGRHGATPAQVCIAWLLSQGQDIIPIPGTKRRTYLEQNAAAGRVRLNAEDIAELEDIRAAGHRTSEIMQRYLNG